MYPTVAGTLLRSGGEWPGVEGSLVLLGIVLLAGVGTGVLFAISALAYAQRRSRRYLLVTAAVGALLCRSVIGLGTVVGVVPMSVHHIVEHSLDFLIAALVLYAVLRDGPERTDLPPDGAS